MDQQTYVILGANSGVAVATCRRLANQGANLILVARDEARLKELSDDLAVRGAGNVTTFAMDLAEPDKPGSFFNTLLPETDFLSGVLVFYGILGDQEKALSDVAHAKEIIDVNFTSAAAWVLESAKALEQSSASHRVLIAISSVAADRGRASNFVYGAAKSGLSVLMQGLSHHWAQNKGQPRAVCFKLGFVDTPMTDGFDKSGPLWAKPDQVAARVIDAIPSGGPIIYTPWFWRWIMLAIRFTPNFVFKRVNL